MDDQILQILRGLRSTDDSTSKQPQVGFAQFSEHYDASADPVGLQAIAWLHNLDSTAEMLLAVDANKFRRTLPLAAKCCWDLFEIYLASQVEATPDKLTRYEQIEIPESPDPLQKFLGGIKAFYRGHLEVVLGDYASAAISYAYAAKHLEPLNENIHYKVRHHMAFLKYSLGSFREALELHCDAKARALAAKEGRDRVLVCSHLSAAKCALELRVAAKANHELIEAQELLERSELDLAQEQAYLVLYSAELDTLWGNTREGIHLFEHAIELFENLTPAHSPGILDAKISLIQFALREQDFPLVFKKLAELLKEAEEYGCLEARAKLIAYQARLLVDKDTPPSLLEQGYKDLVHRAHLINNPRLTYLVYADLYWYSREYLPDEDQAFWLKRLEGLETLLESSSYDELHRTYMLDRYRHKMEKHLRDLPDFSL